MTKRNVLILALMLGLMACSSGDDPTDPQVDPPLAAGTIDESGGEVGTEDAVIEVPAGAFEGGVTLELRRENDVNPYGESQPVFVFSGLPTSFSDTLKLRLPLPADGMKDGGWTLAIGEEAFCPSHGGKKVFWQHVQAQIVDGWLEAPMPPVSGEATKDGATLHPVKVTATATPGVHLSQTGKFKIHYEPEHVSPQQAAGVATLLEEAFNLLVSDGWYYGGTFPRTVELMYKDNPGSYGAWDPSCRGEKHCVIELNSYHVGSLEDMQPTTLHECLHMFQHFYDTRSDWDRANSGGPNYWLDEATATWIEEKVMGPGHLPATREDVEHKPLEGFPMKSGETEPALYGYAMSALIKTMVDRAQDDDWILPVYEAIRDDGADPAQALLDNAPESLDTWYDEFLRDYVGGGPYGDFLGNPVTGGRMDAAAANPADNITEITFENDFRARQGGYYRIRFDSGSWPPDTGIRVTAAANERTVPVTIFRRHSVQPYDLATILTQGLGSAVATNIQPHILADDELLVLVTSLVPDHLVTTVEVFDMPDIAYLLYGRILMDFTAHWEDGSTTEEELACHLPGGMTGMTYNAAWDEYQYGHGRHAEGDFSGTFDPLDLDLESWNLTESRVYDDGGPTVFWMVTGKNLVRDSYPEPGVLWYDTQTSYAVEEILGHHSEHGTLISWEGGYPRDFLIYFYGD